MALPKKSLKKGLMMMMMMMVMNSGLFLVNFLAEPTGLSPHNFTEPDGKTASPAKNNAGWKATQIVCGRERGSEEIC